MKSPLKIALIVSGSLLVVVAVGGGLAATLFREQIGDWLYERSLPPPAPHVPAGVAYVVTRDEGSIRSGGRDIGPTAVSSYGAGAVAVHVASLDPLVPIIALVDNDDGTGAVATLARDGSNAKAPKLIASAPAPVSQILLSSDRKAVLFAAGTQIFRATLDGANATHPTLIGSAAGVVRITRLEPLAHGERILVEGLVTDDASAKKRLFAVHDGATPTFVPLFPDSAKGAIWLGLVSDSIVLARNNDNGEVSRIDLDTGVATPFASPLWATPVGGGEQGKGLVWALTRDRVNGRKVCQMAQIEGNLADYRPENQLENGSISCTFPQAELQWAPFQAGAQPISLGTHVVRVALSPDGGRVAFTTSTGAYGGPVLFQSVALAPGAKPERLATDMVYNDTFLFGPDGALHVCAPRSAQPKAGRRYEWHGRGRATERTEDQCARREDLFQRPRFAVDSQDDLQANPQRTEAVFVLTDDGRRSQISQWYHQVADAHVLPGGRAVAFGGGAHWQIASLDANGPSERTLSDNGRFMGASSDAIFIELANRDLVAYGTGPGATAGTKIEHNTACSEVQGSAPGHVAVVTLSDVHDVALATGRATPLLPGVKNANARFLGYSKRYGVALAMAATPDTNAASVFAASYEHGAVNVHPLAEHVTAKDVNHAGLLSDRFFFVQDGRGYHLFRVNGSDGPQGRYLAIAAPAFTGETTDAVFQEIAPGWIATAGAHWICTIPKHPSRALQADCWVDDKDRPMVASPDRRKIVEAMREGLYVWWTDKPGQNANVVPLTDLGAFKGWWPEESTILFAGDLRKDRLPGFYALDVAKLPSSATSALSDTARLVALGSARHGRDAWFDELETAEWYRGSVSRFEQGVRAVALKPNHELRRASLHALAGGATRTTPVHDEAGTQTVLIGGFGSDEDGS